jgi:hypothetical protein
VAHRFRVCCSVVIVEELTFTIALLPVFEV